MQVQIKETNSQLKIKIIYNSNVNLDFKLSGACWDYIEKEWFWLNANIEHGKKIIKKYFGLSEEIVLVEIPFSKCTILENRIVYKGYVLIERQNFKSTPRLYSKLLKGYVKSYCGNFAVPKIEVSEDTVFLVEVFKDFAIDNYLKIEVIKNMEASVKINEVSLKDLILEIEKRGLKDCGRFEDLQNVILYIAKLEIKNNHKIFNLQLDMENNKLVWSLEFLGIKEIKLKPKKFKNEHIGLLFENLLTHLNHK